MADDEVWTIRRMLDWCTDYLGRKGEERPRLSAEWLLSDACGLSRVELYTNIDRQLTPDELHAMHDGVLRRAAGEPLQYVTGEMPFRHIVLRCEPGVLIPRPETEVLVDAALEGVDRASAAGAAEPRVLEIGCGTGCISCSIASERPDTYVVATDIAPQAVRLAERNAEALGLERRVSIIESDLADGVDDALMGTFSVLVSNPPYIPSDVVPTLPHEVEGFEPHLALDGGPDGLDVFRRLLELAPRALAPGGAFCCELFEDNVNAAADLCREQGGWDSVEVREDLTHRPRVLVARREGDLAAVANLERLAEPEKVLPVDQDTPDRDVLLRAADVLKDGGVLVMPTDSVYGIGCAALPDNPAHERIFEIKRRDRAQTLPWLVASPDDVARYGADVPEWAFELARAFWPGALTLVVEASEAVPEEYRRADTQTIALRCPDSNLVRILCSLVGVPLATTSANTHGEAAATSGSGIEERIVEEADLVLDAGPAPVGTASTIVDCTGEGPKILREGPIRAEDIRRVCMR